MGNDHPELAPYPGQAERALRLVHVRRRRALAVVASAAAVVVLASLLLSARDGGLTMLGPVQPAVAGDPVTERPRRAPAAPAPAAPAGVRGGPGALGAAPAGPALPAVRAHGADDSAAATAPRVAAAAAPSRPAPRTPITRKQARDPAGCLRVVDWCRGAGVARTEGGLTELRAELCRPAVREAARLRFAAEQEVEFAVESAATGEEVWRWSTRAPALRPHAVAVEGGSCVSWTTPWSRVDGYGRALPPGRYVLHVTLLSHEPVALPSVAWQAV